MAPPPPQERFDLAKKHAALLRAVLSHPTMTYKSNGAPDKANIHPTLFNVTDFQMSTYTKYLLPLLPPNAADNCRELSFQPKNSTITENVDLLAENLYPRMQQGELMEKWTDAITRGMMLSLIILDRSKQVMFGGPFDFGNEVETAARALS
ncbi:hypothetical protein A1O1_02448 [Capronia coronata CBS 617.96]|uniref:Uncharacterized protein n=1 Tax=Capronia coronata CBS 617.96 TaxID=1182541 RepID=W9YWK0_9EURO|nr:uncharacterized protein A1O1_02448 [Capronia coronata CBS 617.96]EXJ94055.1 hypothetical protein A1O1_02448 [Capronia coronata CBS 617.96]